MTQRKNLEDSARLLRVRLQDLEEKRRQGISEIDRPIHEVSVNAVKELLTSVGRQLSRLD